MSVGAGVGAAAQERERLVGGAIELHLGVREGAGDVHEQRVAGGRAPAGAHVEARIGRVGRVEDDRAALDDERFAEQLHAAVALQRDAAGDAQTRGEHHVRITGDRQVQLLAALELGACCPGGSRTARAATPRRGRLSARRWAATA